MRHRLPFIAAAAALLLCLGASACRPFTRDTPPAELDDDLPPNALTKMRIKPDTAYLANCKALQDSAAKYGAARVHLWNELDTDAALRKSDDFPRFDPEFGPGRVMAYYVIDPAGRAEPHFVRITYATRPGLETSVRKFLARAMYHPATIGGSPVRVCVRQEFFFNLAQ